MSADTPHAWAVEIASWAETPEYSRVGYEIAEAAVAAIEAAGLYIVALPEVTSQAWADADPEEDGDVAEFVHNDVSAYDDRPTVVYLDGGERDLAAAEAEALAVLAVIRALRAQGGTP